MSSFGSCRIVALGLVAWTTAAFAPASRAQFLTLDKKTAPAPEFQGVTQWINSEPLTMSGASRQGRPGPLLDERML